jgi:hypothetical protein
MPKPLPTDKAAFKLVLRRLAENKENHNQSQLCIELQAADRWAEVLSLYHVPLTPPLTPYDRTPAVGWAKAKEEPVNPYTPTGSVEEMFTKIGGDNAADKSSV